MSNLRPLVVRHLVYQKSFLTVRSQKLDKQIASTDSQLVGYIVGHASFPRFIDSKTKN